MASPGTRSGTDPEKIVRWILEHADSEQFTEFVDGLDDAFRSVIAGEASFEAVVLPYLESWVTSLKLQTDPTWQRQVAETEAKAAAEGFEAPVTRDELRKLTA